MEPNFSRQIFLPQGSNRFYLWMIVVICFAGCDKYPGFKKTNGGIYKRLDQFGDCQPKLTNAEYFIMDVNYFSKEKPDSGYHFQLHHHALHHSTGAEANDNSIGLRLIQELDSLRCGDQITLILPFAEFDNTFIGAFADTPQYAMQEEIELTLHVLKTFTKKEYCSYLMQAAQQQELAEQEAIELLLMNDVELPFEKHGDCFIQYKQNLNGDSVKAGREVIIRYNTYLLNGERLDDTTEMQFNFGKPGQIIGGLQYGLSFLQEGDAALIYLPSYLAFGEMGNTSRIVPPHTPVYFDIQVLSVKTSEEILK